MIMSFTLRVTSCTPLSVSWKYSLNETPVNAATALYPYKCYINNLLNFSEDAKQSHLQSCGFYSFKDVDKHIDRAAKSPNNTYEFYGRLMGDLLNQERLLLPGVELKLKLTRASPQFALKVSTKNGATSSPPSPIFKLLETYIYVRKVKLTANRHLEIEKSLLSSTAKYPLIRVETKIFNFTPGLSYINIPNIVNATLPLKVVVGM